MKPTKCATKRKKNKAEKKKKRGGEKAKKKRKTAVSLLNLKTNSKLCFLHIPELWKLIFCFSIRRLQRYDLSTALW